MLLLSLLSRRLRKRHLRSIALLFNAKSLKLTLYVIKVKAIHGEELWEQLVIELVLSLLQRAIPKNETTLLDGMGMQIDVKQPIRRPEKFEGKLTNLLDDPFRSIDGRMYGRIWVLVLPI